MKKFLAGLSLVVVGMSASAADVYLVGGAADFETNSAKEYGIGFGASKVFENNVLIGIKAEVMVIDVDGVSDSYYGESVDLHLGYAYKDLSIYGIGTLTYHQLTNLNAYGFGGGVGLEYKLFKHLSVAAEYKSSSMTTAADTTYDYSVARGLIKYMF